jgi:uncharacterized protein DUF1488
MPLTRSREKILLTMNGIKFLMEDGQTEIPCRATPDLLTETFGSNGEPADNERVFRLNRSAIEEAASRKYDAGEIEPRPDPKVIVTATDMASPLSRKM